MLEIREVTIEGGLRIRLHEAGRGPAVIMVHGAGAGAGGAVHFRANVDAFVAAGRRVIVPDLIGYGDSSKPLGQPYTLARFTDTLAQALEAAAIGRADFFGNSLGGAVAIDMATRHADRVRRAVLLAPGAMESGAIYFAQPGVKDMLSILAGGLSEETMGRYLSLMVEDRELITPDLIRARLELAQRQPPEVLTSLSLPDLTERLPGLHLPLLVVWGGADRICPVSGALKFAQSCPNATVVIHSGTGHWPMLERAEAVNRDALAFLADQPPALSEKAMT